MIIDAAPMIRSPIEMPLDRIRADQMPWRIRTSVTDLEVESLASAIAKSGYIAPILVVGRPDGDYDLVAGLIRMRAAILLGRVTIHAMVLEGSPRQLLEVAFRDGEARFRESHLDRARAIDRLRLMRLSEGLPCRNVDIARATHLDEGTISSSLTLAATFSSEVEADLEKRHRAPEGFLRGLARQPLRLLIRHPEHRDELFRAGVSAAEHGTAPVKEMRRVLDEKMPKHDKAEEVAEALSLSGDQLEGNTKKAYEEGYRIGWLEARSEVLSLMLDRSIADDKTSHAEITSDAARDRQAPKASRHQRGSIAPSLRQCIGLLHRFGDRIRRWALSMEQGTEMKPCRRHAASAIRGNPSIQKTTAARRRCKNEK